MKKIKKVIFSGLLAIGLFSLNGCDDVKILKVSKELDGGSVDFLLAPQSSMDYDVTESDQMDIAELIKPYNLSLDQIKSLTIESANIEIIDSLSAKTDFDMVDNTSAEIGTSSIAQKKIAFKDPVPKTALKVLSLDVDKSVDMIPFAKANDINYHLKLKLNKALVHPVIMKLSVKWKVEGEI